MTISNITDRKCVRCNQERLSAFLPAHPDDPDQSPLLAPSDDWITGRNGDICPDCMTLGERLNYDDRCTRCGRQDEHEDDENEWNADDDGGNLCHDCYSRFDSLHFIASLLRGTLLRAQRGELYPDLRLLEFGTEIAESLRAPGRYFVQTAHTTAEEEGGGWETHGVYATRAKAERMERFFASGELHEATITAEGGRIGIELGNEIPVVVVSRVVDIRDLMSEGHEEVSQAIGWLATSDHEWAMTLGTVQSRYHRAIPGIDDQDDDEAAAA